MKYIKINVYNEHNYSLFTSTDKLRSFIDGVQQEEGGHENLGNFANGSG